MMTMPNIIPNFCRPSKAEFAMILLRLLELGARIRKRAVGLRRAFAARLFGGRPVAPPYNLARLVSGLSDWAETFHRTRSRPPGADRTLSVHRR